MKRKLLYCALMIVLIGSVLFVCSCGDTSELAGKASGVVNEETQEPEGEKTSLSEDGDQSSTVKTADKNSEASVLIQDIDELDETTLDSKEQLESIRGRYDALSEKDKKLVTNYEKFTKAEEEFKALEDEESRQNYTVWCTRTGSCYHIEGCRHLRTKYESMTQKEAIDRGLEPCSDCISAYWIAQYWYDRNKNY